MIGDDRRDWETLHFAVGLLVGLGHKYGVIDVTIYHNDIRVQITPGVSNDRQTTERRTDPRG